jgi:hypothetical protein
MALCWVTLPLLTGCGGLLLQLIGDASTPPLMEGEERGSGTMEIGIPVMIFLASMLFSAPVAFAGFLTGIATGLWAPATEPGNPFRSTFFRRVGWQTFWGWLVTFFALFLLGSYKAETIPLLGVTGPLAFVLSLGLCLKIAIAGELERA